MYNCILLLLTIFNKEIIHVSVSAHIKWKSNPLHENNQNTDSSYLQGRTQPTVQVQRDIVRVTFYFAVFVSLNVYVSHSAHKKCTSQPLVVTAYKTNIVDTCVVAQNQRNKHRRRSEASRVVSSFPSSAA